MGSDIDKILALPALLLEHLEIVWTFLLLLTRFSTMFLVIPGIGSITGSIAVRMPAILILAMVSTITSQHAAVPEDWGLLGAEVISEAFLGFALGLIPYLIVSGVQTGAQLASTTMGLGVGNLIDPTSGQTTADLAQIMGDLMVVFFLLIGGHHAIIYAASGLGGQIVPGTYFITERTLNVLIDHTAMIFRIGLLVSSPVIVALMLTNFVMGLISKAVPSVNIFIISFPLSIGIGLTLSLVALPDATVFAERHFGTIETQVMQVLSDATLIAK